VPHQGRREDKREGERKRERKGVEGEGEGTPPLREEERALERPQAYTNPNEKGWIRPKEKDD
jgi:hypothetical protein